MTLIGFDFSINKPASCVFHNNEYHFISWPYKLKEEIIELYTKSGVTIIPREDDKNKGETLSSKMRYEVENSKYLSSLIFITLKSYLNINTFIGFEGLSYGSSGDVVLQLGGYKYILMNELSKLVPLENMYTYSPISVKSIAGCAKKGMGKSNMIEEFIKSGPNCKFRTELSNNREKFQTVKSKNWIIHLDDIIDAFWTLKTLEKKENFYTD